MILLKMLFYMESLLGEAERLGKEQQKSLNLLD